MKPKAEGEGWVAREGGAASIRILLALLATLLWSGCQGLPGRQSSTSDTERTHPMPVSQPLGSNNNMLEMLDSNNKELQESRSRIRELEGDLAALTSEHAKLKIDFDDLSVTAQDRGAKLAKAEAHLEGLERELIGERDERARITDLFLSATIEKLRLERELLTLRLDLQDQ